MRIERRQEVFEEAYLSPKGSLMSVLKPTRARTRCGMFEPVAQLQGDASNPNRKRTTATH